MKVGLSIRLFTPDSGGLQLHAARLAEHLRLREYKVTIATRALSKVPTFQELFWYSDPETDLLGKNIVLLKPSSLMLPLLWLSYQCCGRPNLRRLGVFLYKVAYLSKTLAAFRGCNVVHHVGQGSEMIGFAAEAAARRLKIPFVIQPTIHPGQWGDSPIDFQLYRKADRILAHTRFERDYFIEHGFSQPIDIVGNGIDDRQDGVGERFRQAHGVDGVMILFLGRKEPDKGYFLLHEAFQLLGQRATLVSVGPGDGMKCGSENLIGNRNIELGFIEENEKHDALAACDIFCVPSEGESFGLVFMEAARYSKPSVCRRIPVLEELLLHGAAFVGTRGINGKALVSAQELATELDSLITDKNARETLGEGAYKASESYLWPVVAHRFCKAYDQAMKQL